MNVQIETTGVCDLLACPDIFVSGIARIEKMTGDVYRFVFYVEQMIEDGHMCKVVAARILVPGTIIPIAIKQAAYATGDMGMWLGLLH